MKKKLLTVLMALSLIVSGITYTPKEVNASVTVDLDYGWQNVGNWDFYASSGGGSPRYRLTYNDATEFAGMDIMIRSGTTTGNQWNTQCCFTIPGSPLVSGQTYNYTLKVASTAAGKYFTQFPGLVTSDRYDIAAGEHQEKTGTFTAGRNPSKGNFLIGLYGMPSGSTLSMEEITITNTQGTVVYQSKLAEPTTAPEAVIDAPTNVAGYNFYANGTGYQVVFKPGADGAATSYNLYVDNSAVVATFSAQDCTVVDSKKGYVAPPNFAANLFTQFAASADNAVHDIYVEAVDSNGNKAKSQAGKMRITSASFNAQPASDPTNLSRVYISTNDAIDIDSYNGNTKEQSKQSASIVLISGDSRIQSANHYGSVKLRGNSTSFANKKAYNITFNDKKTVIKGAAKGKKWCLLANAYDKSLIRSRLAFDLGAKLGQVAVPGSYYVDVYVNGVYKGVYVLCEPAENGRGGVSYDSGDNSNDIAFELEKNNKDESSLGVAYYTTSRYGMRYCTEDLEDQVLALYEGGTTSISGITSALQSSSTKFSGMIQTLNNFETALASTGSTSYLNYIDVNSFVDMYIANELFNTQDFGYSSVKFYITYSGNTPTIHAGPLWDFDLSSGNSYYDYVRPYNQMRCQSTNAWFGQLMKNSDFANRVKTKYQSMQGYIQNLYQDNTIGTNEIDKNIAEMGQSRTRNYTSKANGGAGWSESTAEPADSSYHYSYSSVSPYSSYNYSQHISYLRDWLQNKNEYMVNQWGLSLSTEPTTEEPTTVQPTTIQPTTVQPTTVQPTTVQPTTVQPTTEAPTVITGYCGSTKNGADGTNLSWSLNKNTGVLTITGSGAMQEWTGQSQVPWYSNRTEITSIVLPNGLTTIEKCAFYYCSSITSITIPNNVTRIGNNAFTNCRGLTSITIPNSVTSMGANIFYGCSALTSITLSNNITSIEAYEFYGCKGLTSITIPSNVTVIENSAFYNCSGLTGIIIPGNVTNIGNSAFYNCSGLTSITIPSNVTNISNNAFRNCSHLTDIYIYNPDCNIYNYSNTIYPDTTIHGYIGSTAETYATTYNRNFVPLDEPTTVQPTTVQPTTVQPTTVQPTTVQPTTVEPATNASSVEADFKIASKTLALSSGISLVFKVNKSLFENRYSEPKIVVLLDGFETEITEYTDEGSRYAFEFTKITPDKMNVMVEATLHATKNGKDYVSPVTEYSVATYVYNMLNKYGETPGMETFRTLLVDLLNYGAASQNYTNYNTDNPANAELTATQRSWATASVGNLISVKNNKYQTIESPSVLWKSAGLALQDAVIVKMKIQADSTDGLVVRVTDDYGTIWNIEPEDFELASGTVNQYYISFKGFNVGRMSDSMYFTVYRNGVAVSNTYRYSVESYVLQYMNSGDALGALVTAMMKYGKSAQAYSS